MSRTRPSRRLSGAALVVALVVVASAAARSLWGLAVEGLWVVPDEMIWAELGRSLWSDGSLRVFGGAQQVFGVVYPALAGAPLALGGLESGYDALKVVQAVVMSLTAVPVYLWARRLAGAWWAALAAALTLAVPGLVYSGLVMSEVAFYPAMVLAAWALAAALERPTAGAQTLLVAAVVLAAATRLQALVLPGVLVTAALVQALIERDVRRTLRLWPAVAALFALAAAWVAARTLAAGDPAAALGGYAAAAGADYALGDALRMTLYHTGALVLGTALFPACAVALLLAGALVRREPSPAVRAYLATTVALAVWLIPQAGVFASVYVDGLSTRYLLPLAPLLFVGFAVWLSRGAPRTQLAAGAVAVAALALLLVLPLRELVVQEAAWQSPSTIPLLWLREHVSDGAFELLVWVGAALALAAFAVVPRRAATLLLPAALVAGLVAASAAASREVVQNVARDQRDLVGGRHGWVDAAAGGDAAYLYVGEQPLNVVWHQLFWNRRLDVVYALGGMGADVSLPVGRAAHARRDGVLIDGDGRPLRHRLVVAVDAVALEGEQVDRVPLAVADQSGLVLWRVAAPARIRSLRTGVRENGDMHEPGRLTAWDCAGGRLDLTLLPKAATEVALRVNGRTVETLRFAGEEFVNAAIHAPPRARVCRFEVVPNGLLGSTVFEFARP